MTKPTIIQKVHKLEDEFVKITKKHDLDKTIKKFYKNPTSKNYNYIVECLNIDLKYQYLNNSMTNIYLFDKNYKIIVSYKNGIFSTFNDYTQGINLYSDSEEQEILNQYKELKKDKYVSVNLLEEPVANLLLNNGIALSGLLYYLSAIQPKHKNYSLAGFVYKNIAK